MKYNGNYRGLKSLGHLCNVINYLCSLHLSFEKSTAILLKRAAVPPPPLPTQNNVENQEKMQEVVFKILYGDKGEVRQVKLCSRLEKLWSQN